jgi:hypothetical protein
VNEDGQNASGQAKKKEWIDKSEAHRKTLSSKHEIRNSKQIQMADMDMTGVPSYGHCERSEAIS